MDTTDVIAALSALAAFLGTLWLLNAIFPWRGIDKETQRTDAPSNPEPACSCGARLRTGGKFCPRCGVPKVDVQEKMRQEMAAAWAASGWTSSTVTLSNCKTIRKDLGR